MCRISAQRVKGHEDGRIICRHWADIMVTHKKWNIVVVDEMICSQENQSDTHKLHSREISREISRATCISRRRTTKLDWELKTRRRMVTKCFTFHALLCSSTARHVTAAASRVKQTRRGTKLHFTDRQLQVSDRKDYGIYGCSKFQILPQHFPKQRTFVVASFVFLEENFSDKFKI